MDYWDRLAQSRGAAGPPEPAADEPTFYNVHSIATLQDVLSYDYIVKGWMARGETSAIYGPSRSGKTFAALHIAYNVSLGLPVFGRRVRQTPVLYVCLEGKRGFELRVRGISNRFGNSEDFFWVKQRTDLHGRPEDAAGIAAAARIKGAGLIVIDTLARALGGGNEKEGQDMNLLIDNVMWIAEESNAHACLVHHTGKDVTKGMRGASELEGAVDAAFETSRQGMTAARTMTVKKCKDGEDGEEFPFSLEQVKLGIDDDGDDVTTCIVREEQAPETAVGRGKDMAASEKTALKALHSAIEEYGRFGPQSDHIPLGAKVVPLETWRLQAYKMGISPKGTEEGKRKAFNRVVPILQNSGVVGTWDDWVWPTAAA
jgi:hypothetical protein